MDIGFIKDNKWFRLRVCAIIVKDNKILMCKNERDDFYYKVRRVEYLTSIMDYFGAFSPYHLDVLGHTIGSKTKNPSKYSHDRC